MVLIQRLKFLSVLLVLALVTVCPLSVSAQTDTAISGLPAAAAVNGSEAFPCVQSGITKKCTVQQYTQVYYPEDYGDTNGANSQVAIQAAIDAAVVARGGTIQLKNKQYTTNGPIVPKSNVTLKGIASGSYQSGNSVGTTIFNATGDVFQVQANVEGFAIHDMRLRASAGHIFNTQTFFFTKSVFKNTWWIQNSLTFKAFHSEYSDTKYVGQLYFDDFVFQFIDGRSTPLFLFTTDTVNHLHFRNGIVVANGQALPTAYAFEISSVDASGGAFAENISFTDVNFEVTRGGMVNLKGVRDVLFTNVSLFDVTAVPDNPMVQIGVNDAAAPSINITFINCLIRRNHATVPDVYIDGNVGAQGRVVFVGGTFGRVKGSANATPAGKFLNLNGNVANWEVATYSSFGPGNGNNAVGNVLGWAINNDAAALRGFLKPGTSGNRGVLHLYDATLGAMRYLYIDNGTVVISATEPS